MSIQSTVSNFFNWWGTSLSFVLSKRIKWIVFGEPIGKTAIIDPNIEDIANTRNIISIPQKILTTGNDRTTKKLRHRVVVDLVVPKSEILYRKLEFPKLKFRELHKAVKLENTRNTPFKEGTVSWIIETDQTDETVVQKICKIAALEDLSNKLAEQRILVRSFLDERGQIFQTPSDFLYGYKVFRKWNLFNGILLLVILAAVGLFQFNKIQQSKSVLEATEYEVDQARSEALDLRKELNSEQSLQKEKSHLIDMITNPITAADILREVTVALPDNSWIYTLEYEKPEITITGTIRGSAAELVLNLSKTRKFENPRIVGVISKGQGAGTEKFTIALTYKGGRI